jgi:ubiquinol-cytochrome c reductase cytochrome b subunit
MALSLVCFILLPWLDRSPVKSTRYRGWMWKTALAVFVVSFVALGYLGLAAPSDLHALLAQIATVLYFAFFVLMPFYTKWDPVKPVPTRVSFDHDHK